MNQKFVSLVMTFIIAGFPLNSLAVAPSSYETIDVSTNSKMLDYFATDSGIKFSSDARIEIESGVGAIRNTKSNYITITEQTGENLFRKTIVAPYESTTSGMRLMAPDEFQNRELPNVSSHITSRAVTNPPYSFNGLVLYLSCYYQREYSPDYANCYRFINLYAVATSGNYNVQNFYFQASAGGAKVTLAPYQRITENYQYVDTLSVSNMTISGQYSRSCNSISPYYIDTGYGQLFFFADLQWGGTYNGSNFYSAYGLPTG